jgi:hypothetical protein
MVELIPGTSLPMYAPASTLQPEGRGDVKITPERQPHSLLERIDDPANLTETERIFVQAALRAFDRKPLKTRHVDIATGGVTDATTGNLVVPLYLCPQGSELHITNVTVDAPGSATINPSAPFANAASFMFLAKAGANAATNSANATTLRPGMVAFAPTSAAGPIIPGQWTFNDSNARIAFGNEQVYFVLIGGSVAAILGVSLRVSFRFNLLSEE